MEFIGKNIEALERLINTPIMNPPKWVRNWQINAEHILALAHMAKDTHDLEQLKMLDEEAIKLIDSRHEKTK